MGECPHCGSTSLSCGCGPARSTPAKIGDGGMIDLCVYTSLARRGAPKPLLVKLAKEVRRALRGKKTLTTVQKDMLARAKVILSARGPVPPHAPNANLVAPSPSKPRFVVKRIVNRERKKSWVTWDIYEHVVERDSDSMIFVSEFAKRGHALAAARGLNSEGTRP